ncbi:voltage-dependent T-type calcium channel subunit alpha-1G-like isoform X2 [Paramacrobiotus metropolitanus]|uniref:voltage-dependent T-type calcium channel subunit alpha-1G-like isoform X2 n=1 Tax=Paramacrobiotus metropolitanus TaxID=2943436 RepID=UPI00244618A7|nr:voltage-dependent T-type calcium channel subunit alpha-1G-like isoform X2 [Paramacrobiotus metropolitanus]
MSLNGRENNEEDSDMDYHPAYGTADDRAVANQAQPRPSTSAPDRSTSSASTNNHPVPDQPTTSRIIIPDNAAAIDNNEEQINERMSIKEPLPYYDYIPAEPLPFPGFIPVSFLCLRQTSKLRTICLQMMLSSWFERVSMAVILLNCVTLALYQPCDGICDTPGCHILAIADHLIFAFFALEMVIKMIAMGVFGKKTYLADSWNRLDFFIVIAGLVEYLLNMENMNLSAIRTIRVLRPLRAINRVPSMRILVMLLLDTLPMLGSTFLLAFFVFFSFGIVGVQLWAGLLRNRCTLSGSGNITFPRGIPKYYEPQHTYLEYVCSLPKDDGMHTCDNLPPYIENNRPCNGSLNDLIWGPNNSVSVPANTCINWHQYYTICRASEKNPFLGAISFDNIGTAWVAIFLVISLEGWSEIMYLVQDAHSFWVFIYFVILIVIGSFFMINLCLVVIATQFSETKKRETERMIAERARYHSTSSLGSGAEPGGCYRELVRYCGHLWRRAKRKAKAYYTEAQEKKIKKQLLKRTAQGYYGKEGFSRPTPTAQLSSAEMSCERHPDLSLEGSLALVPFDYTRRTLDVQQSSGTGADKSSERSSTVSFMDGGNNPPDRRKSEEYSRDSITSSAAMPAGASTVATITVQPEEPTTLFQPAADRMVNVETHNMPGLQSETSSKDPAATTQRAFFNRNCEIDETSYFWIRDAEPEKPQNRLIEFLTAFRAKVQQFVGSKFFERGILVAILINTLSMGIEHHLQPDELTIILEYCNFFFTALFCIEMLLKMMADGVFGYLSNGYNLFDCVIVVLSLIEIVQAGGSGLSVLRTFRLLRILKLVRFMPALKRQLVVMIRTMDNVATFFALLLLFIFVFSILAMTLFGCQKLCRLTYDGVLKCPRTNFDRFIWSFVTVFQILTQEDWNYVLYLAMRYTSHWAAIYFIALMTFGNYVLFNLLVAILVEGFADDDIDSSKTSESPKNIRDAPSSTFLESEDGDGEPAMAMTTMALSGAGNSDKILPRLNGPSLALPVITRTAATPIDGLNVNENLGLHNRLLYVPNRSNSSQSTASDVISSVESERAASVDQRPEDAERRMSKSESERMEREFELEEFRAHPFRFSTRRWKRKSKDPSGFDPNRRSRSLANPFEIYHPHKDKRKSSYDSTMAQIQPLASSPTSKSNGNSGPLRNGSPGSGVLRKSCLKQGVPMRSLSVGRSPRTRPIVRRVPYNPEIIESPHGDIVLPPSLRFDSMCSVYPLSRRDSPAHPGLTVDAHTDNPVADTDREGPLSPLQARRTQRLDSNSPNNSEKKIWWIPERCTNLRKRYYYSYFVFPPHNQFRLFCANFSDHKYFDYVILLCIGLNCITLAMERPSIPPYSTEREILIVSNYIFTIIFTVEMALKTIGHGLFLGSHPYTSSSWNVMDGILVAISLVDVFIGLIAPSNSPKIFGILRVFRLLRSLRPLRVINRAPGLKLVVETLLTSLRPIGNIVLISAIFFIIFGILGVQLFKGTFWYCHGPPAAIRNVRNRSDCDALRREGVVGVQWINRKYNFDNLGQALMALFVLSSKDGWVNIMYNGLDAVGVDLQPSENFNEWRLLYFISFLLLVGFFVLNMFVGVVVENFHRCREEQEAEERARRAVKRAERLERKRQKLRAPPYYANYSKFRLYQHNVVTSKYFDLAIALVIGLNVVTMAMEYYLMPNELMYALKIFNYFFTAVFFFEAFFKLMALGIKRYVSDKWNQLDIAIVILSVVGIILEEMENDLIPINPTIIRVMRVLRIARILKLLKMARGIRALLDTVFQALPQVTNLGTLFFLLFFIFSTLGVELFGRLECDDLHPCEGLGEHAHFRNFGMAFLTLFRVATGDNWNGIMKDALREDCRSDDACITNCCVSPIIAPIYFVIFVLLAQFTLVNVVVAVLMRHLQESNQIMRDDALLDEEIERELHTENLRQLERQESQQQERIALLSINTANEKPNEIPTKTSAIVSAPPAGRATSRSISVAESGSSPYSLTSRGEGPRFSVDSHGSAGSGSALSLPNLARPSASIPKSPSVGAGEYDTVLSVAD